MNDCVIFKHEVKGGQSANYLLIADVHLDSKNCQKKLLKSHLEQAKQRNAKVLIFGDLFDAMQSRNDKRSDKLSLKQSDIQGTYFNQIISEAYNFLEPYKEQIEFISYGNHETKVMKYSEIDLIKILSDKLGCKTGNYQGFLRFHFTNLTGGCGNSYVLYYHHGGGGNAVMTMGTLQHKRASIWVDADIIVSGHNHEHWIYEQMRLESTQRGELRHKKQTHVKLPTYNAENNGFGFLVEKWASPRPLGGVWLNFKFNNHFVTYNLERTDNG